MENYKDRIIELQKLLEDNNKEYYDNIFKAYKDIGKSDLTFAISEIFLKVTQFNFIVACVCFCLRAFYDISRGVHAALGCFIMAVIAITIMTILNIYTMKYLNQSKFYLDKTKQLTEELDKMSKEVYELSKIEKQNSPAL